MSQAIRLNKYQKKAKKDLLKAVVKRLNDENREGEYNPIGFKSPTGSGKTIMLLETVKELTEMSHKLEFDFFITWLAPYSLAEQSLVKFKNAGLNVLDLSDLTPEMVESELTNSIGFAGYDKVNKENNILIRGNEFGTSLSNIYEDMHDQDVVRIFIIDEAHIGAGSDATKINAFIKENADIELHVSATLKDLDRYSLIEVDHQEVVDSGFIKKSVKFNEDFFQSDEDTISDETAILRTALKKLDDLKVIYEAQTTNVVNPLMLMQVADGQIDKEALIAKIVELTKVENGFQYPVVAEDIAFYISGEHGIDPEDCRPKGLKRIVVTKTAAVTGWDCPRAQVLLSSRNVKSVTATDQLIGRILRMPYLEHYETERDALNHAYVYCLKSELEEIFSRPQEYSSTRCSHSRGQKLKLKQLVKINIPYIGKIELNDNIDVKATRGNCSKLLMEAIETSSYDFSLKGATNIISGVVENIDELGSVDSKNAVLSQKLGKEQLIHAIKKLRMSQADASKIAEKLNETSKMSMKEKKINFRYSYDSLLCNYDLVIKVVRKSIVRKPNGEKQKQFDELVQKGKDSGLTFSPQDQILLCDAVQLKTNGSYKKYAYTPGDPLDMNKLEENVGKLFDEEDDIAFWMKNGDYGKNFFSINYLDKDKVREFYPDFIVQKRDGSIELVESKGDHLLTADEMKLKLASFKAYENETGIKCYIAVADSSLKAGAVIYSLDSIDEVVNTEGNKVRAVISEIKEQAEKDLTATKLKYEFDSVDEIVTPAELIVAFILRDLYNDSDLLDTFIISLRENTMAKIGKDLQGEITSSTASDFAGNILGTVASDMFGFVVPFGATGVKLAQNRGIITKVLKEVFTSN